MMHLADHLLREYGYGVITLALAVECAGLLFPGETVFFCSAIYASSTGHLNIVLIIVAAIFGAILGNVIGFTLGRLVGGPMLARYGWRIGLTDRRLALGRYLFRRHGGKVVFFCRFVSVLRSFNALLAGASQMRWRNFLGWTVAGGIVWPCVHGLFAYVLGDTASRLSGRLQILLVLATLAVVVAVLRFVKQNELRLEEVAMRSEHYERNPA
jgi:membrane protein DedA with SNARE-associated domain